VELAAIKAAQDNYEQEGWSVTSVERQKVGYDLLCKRRNEEEHVEVKGTQGETICFIITAGEMRNVLLDRKHITLVVTEALTSSPNLHRYDKERFLGELNCEPIAFRAIGKPALTNS
jgi:hypothetical protein